MVNREQGANERRQRENADPKNKQRDGTVSMVLCSAGSLIDERGRVCMCVSFCVCVFACLCSSPHEYVNGILMMWFYCLCCFYH